VAEAVTPVSDIYYDPFDIEIDKDPHPLWKRMRDEAPLYYNDKYEFYALSRFDDVEKAMTNWEVYRSGHGSTPRDPDGQHRDAVRDDPDGRPAAPRRPSQLDVQGVHTQEDGGPRA
jgi:cytochrome P450